MKGRIRSCISQSRKQLSYGKYLSTQLDNIESQKKKKKKKKKEKQKNYKSSIINFAFCFKMIYEREI